LAGADTTAASISFIIMAAACFPQAQRQVQAQLDIILGDHRSPSISDEELLPTVTAFMLECARWRPISINGFPHRATRDIYWHDYCIPKGSTVIGSHWCISRSPDVFPEPEKFMLQRWLDSTGKLLDDRKKKSFAFGFGRRVCPGQHLANKSLFITTAYILWAFNISQDVKVPIDTLAFTQTANIHPLPFKVLFEPRIPKEKLLQKVHE